MSMWDFGQTLDLHITEKAVRARDVAEGSRVRPSGWHGYQAALCTEPLRGGFVRILWRCDPGDRPVEPFTVFDADEWLAVQP